MSTHTYRHTYTHTHTHTYTDAYTHTHTHTYTDAYTHTHTYTYKRAHGRLNFKGLFLAYKHPWALIWVGHLKGDSLCPRRKTNENEMNENTELYMEKSFLKTYQNVLL